MVPQLNTLGLRNEMLPSGLPWTFGVCISLTKGPSSLSAGKGGQGDACHCWMVPSTQVLFQFRGPPSKYHLSGRVDPDGKSSTPFLATVSDRRCREYNRNHTQGPAGSSDNLVVQNLRLSLT